AKALIVVAREDNLKDYRLFPLRYDSAAADAGLPVIVVSRAMAAKLLGTNITESATVIGGTLSLSVDVIRRESPSFNVIGVLPGSDPKLKNEVIVIGSHYDHLGRGGEGSLAPRAGAIHHGADDNASGVAGLLELARMFSSQNPKPRRTIIFIAFSGEEEGLIGSNYYVNHPIVPLA